MSDYDPTLTLVLKMPGRDARMVDLQFDADALHERPEIFAARYLVPAWHALRIDELERKPVRNWMWRWWSSLRL